MPTEPARAARALVEHWRWAAGKGLMNKKTAQTLAGACRGVLGVQDGWEDMDVNTLDIEICFIKFKNLRASDFSPNSLRDYESRFNRAVQSYREYLDDPAKWRFPSKASPTRSSSASRRRSRPEASPVPASTQVEPPDISRPDSGSQEYSYPIRPDVLATLVIPRDATSTEINRLVAWARTLAADYEPDQS